MLRFISLLAISMTAFSAQALELACWDTYSKKGSRPYLTAQINATHELSNLKLNKRTDEYPVDSLLDVPAQAFITPVEITSNRSPYKGNAEYQLKWGRLILPTDLSPDALKAKIKTGIGMGPEENGVIIGTLENGDGAGNHYSIRLRCFSK